MRHPAHHRFENCNYGVTTIFWDIVFRTDAGTISEHIRSGAGYNGHPSYCAEVSSIPGVSHLDFLES